MKKAVILAFILIITVCTICFSKTNNIYSADISNKNGVLTLNLRSDYNEKIKVSKENPYNIYFDIENAKLSDRFMANSNDTSVMVQQIGSKVRIYINGGHFKDVKTNMTGHKGNMPMNPNKIVFGLMFLYLIGYLARKAYFDTIELAKDKSTTIHIKTAIDLNEQLYNMDRKSSPVIAAHNMTNTISKQDVYVDFQYAKDRKNIKIAI